MLGSASPELLRQSSETLAGRIAFHDLPGLHCSELRGVRGYSLDRLWLRGGFPAAYLARNDAASQKWRIDFVRTFLQRDIPALQPGIPSAQIERFWRMLAHWHGQLWNAAELARSLGTTDPTARRYLDLLAQTFVLRVLRPWHENLAKRQVKSPKVYIADSGLLHALLGQVTQRLGARADECHFWATHQGAELDLLVVPRWTRHAPCRAASGAYSIPMLRALAIVPFTACLIAQEAPNPLRYVPPDAVLVLRSKGPAALRTELGATGVGKALASPAIADAVKGIGKFLLSDLDLGDEMAQRLETLWTAVAGHEGAIVVGASIALPITARGKAPKFAVSLAAFGDGHTDLQAVAAALRGLLPPDEAREQAIGGLDLRVHRFDDVAVTEPVVHDGAVLMFCSNDLEAAVTACLGERTTPFPAAPELLRGAMGMQCEFQGFLPGLFQTIVVEEGEQNPLVEMLPGLLDELGGRSMLRGAATLYADGAQIVQEGMLEFGDGPRGLFDVVLPVRTTAPVLLRLLPPGAGSFTLSSFDLDALHRLYVQMFAAHGEMLPMTREEVEQKFTEFTKLRLNEDLLALVGGEMLAIEDLAAMVSADEEEDPQLERVMSEYGETCYVVRLRDGKTFAGNLEKMVRARGLHAGRKSEEYGGVRVYRLKLLGTVPIEYAVTGEALVFAVGGAGSQRNLRGVLDAIAASGRGEAPAGLPQALQERLATLPPDYTHLSAGALGEALDGMVGVFEGLAADLAAEDMTLEDLDGAWHLVLPAVKALRADLKRFGADVSVTAGYSTKGKSTFRSRW